MHGDVERCSSQANGGMNPAIPTGKDRNRQGRTPDLASKCLKQLEIFPLTPDGLEAKSLAGRIRDSSLVGNLFAVASLHRQRGCGIQRDADDTASSVL